MNHAKPSLIRFSLRTLLVLMMLICIALATTVSTSPRVEYVMKWISALAPAVAILLAASTSGTKRAFWIGFAAFGIWSQVQLSRNSDAGDYLREKFAKMFRETCRDQMAELHSNKIEDERMKGLRNTAKYIFHNNRDITLEQIQIRYASDYNVCKAWARYIVVNRAGIIAWQWLRLAVLLAGGLAVATIYARSTRNRKRRRPFAAG